jgi:hypothetical protein
MIILLGFPKSGTSSFQKLFKILGIESYHQIYKNIFIAQIMKRNLKCNKPLLYGFDKHIAITQLDYCFPDLGFWPQITHYERLYDENKDAIFILNKRNSIELLESFKKWNSLNERIININPELFVNINGTTNDEKLINLFNTHYENIETFFSTKSEAKFIIYHITEDKIDKISKYIDIKDLDTFPHENKNVNK